VLDRLRVRFSRFCSAVLTDTSQHSISDMNNLRRLLVFGRRGGNLQSK